MSQPAAPPASRPRPDSHTPSAAAPQGGLGGPLDVLSGSPPPPLCGGHSSLPPPGPVCKAPLSADGNQPVPAGMAIGAGGGGTSSEPGRAPPTLGRRMLPPSGLSGCSGCTDFPPPLSGCDVGRELPAGPPPTLVRLTRASLGTRQVLDGLGLGTSLLSDLGVASWMQAHRDAARFSSFPLPPDPLDTRGPAAPGA